MCLLLKTCPWSQISAQRPILGCVTFTAEKVPGKQNELVILPGKAVPSDQAAPSVDPEDADNWRLSADPSLHLGIRSFLEWASGAVFLLGYPLTFTVGITLFCRYIRFNELQSPT